MLNLPHHIKRITFVAAHFLEALSFIEYFKMSKINHSKGIFQDLNYFENQEQTLALLICGEGDQNATENLCHYLCANFDNPPDLIINIGVAAALTQKAKDYKIGEVFQVDRIVHVAYALKNQQLNLTFQSYTSDHSHFSDSSDETGHHLITVSERLNAEDIQFLSQKLGPLGSLVDREGWALARQAKRFKIPFMALKAISDYGIHEQTDAFDRCHWVREKGHYFSNQLLEKLKSLTLFTENLQTNSPPSTSFLLPQVKMSHYQSHQLKKLIQRYISLNSQKSWQDYLKNCSHNSVAQIIKELDFMLSPHKKIFYEQLENYLAPLKTIGVHIHHSSFEVPHFKITYDINHEKNISDLNHALTELPWKKITSLYEGDLSNKNEI